VNIEEFWDLLDQWRRVHPEYEGIERSIDAYEKAKAAMPHIEYETYTAGSTRPMRKVVQPDGNWHWELDE
jgi:hypothetical protein